MPHSSYEITVCCRYTFFSCCHNTHMSTHTRSTAWCVDCTSCVYEDFQKAFSDTLFVYLLCSRNDHNTYIRMNSMSLKNGSCFSHIFHSSVCTGSDHDLIDLDWFHCFDLVNRLRIARKMRKCYCWTDFGKIDLYNTFIFCVLICFVHFIFFLCMFF